MAHTLAPNFRASLRWWPTTRLSFLAWLALVLLVSGLIYMLPFWPGLVRSLTRKSNLMTGLVLGAAGFCLVWRYWLSRWAWWRALDTLEHELAHMLAAWSVGGRLVSLQVQASGCGSVRWEGARGQWWVALAPYWVPTPLIFGLLFLGKPILAQGLAWSWAGWLQAVAWGALLALHAISTWRETSTQQPDLQQVGLTYAMIFLAGTHMLILTLTIRYLVS